MDCVAIGTGIMLDNIDKIPNRKFGWSFPEKLSFTCDSDPFRNIHISPN
jgi:hypothetical protein